MEGREEEGGEGRWEGGGGAGGKITRRSLARRPPAATPYDRPRPSAGARREGDEGGGKSWFSKAKLLLTAAASRVPPSFSSPPAASASEDLARRGSPAAPPLEVEQDSHVDIAKQVFNSQASHFNEMVSSARDDCPKRCRGTDEHAGGKQENTYDGITFADIEQRLKQRTFSRDESNRLMELLRSRTIGLGEDDKNEVGFIAYDTGNAWNQTDVRKSIEEKKPVQMNLRVHKERVFDEVGASPVEIAKAFMEARSSASHQNFHGAVVQADHGYFTPQGESGRTRHHNIPRTPCPGESFQSSITKFQCSSERGPDLPFAGWKQSPAPIFGTNKIHIKTVKKGISTSGNDRPANLSVLGPEQKSMTMSASEGAIPYNSGSFRSLLSTRSDVFGTSTSMTQRNLQPGSSRCNIFEHRAACAESDSSKTAASLLSVHPKSSEVARKIFEHLDRTAPSPQEKSFDSKFLIEKKTLPPSGVTKMLNGPGNKASSGSPSSSFLLGDNIIRGNAEVQKANREGSLDLKGSVTNTGLPQTCGSGCVSSLSSISKPEKASSFPHHGVGFSFPSVSSNASCEPPAIPTVALRSSASKEGNIPSFSFGSTVGRGPVFSFGSVGYATPIRVVDSSIPPYGFGANDNSRICFGSFGNNAVCY